MAPPAGFEPATVGIEVPETASAKVPQAFALIRSELALYG